MKPQEIEKIFNLERFESIMESIRSEKQAKTRGTAVEFAVDMISPFTTDYKEILTKLYNDRFDEWFTNKWSKKK